MQKDIAAPSAEEMEEWINKIRQIAQSANDMVCVLKFRPVESTNRQG